MTANFATCSVTATGATATRSFGDRFADVVNVKDYGATGDGSTNDTAAIQVAFNAAYGSSVSPHGTSYSLNKPVFFPAGNYIVSAPATISVTGAVNDGTGKVKLTVSSTSGWTTNDVKVVSGVVGTTEANGRWKITVVDSTHITLQGSTFANAYVSGGIVSSIALTLTNVQGAKIYGAGRFTTGITLATSGAILLGTDGFEYSSIEDIFFSGPSASTGSVALDLDRVTGASGFVSVQSNHLQSLYVYNFDVGIRVGLTGSSSQGSEHTFLNCYVTGCASYGYFIGNANALQHSIIGGNISACDVGAYIYSGSAQFFNVAFQANTTWDIQQANDANDVILISGGRSESANVVIPGGVSLVMQGFTHVSAAGNGTFANLNACPAFNITGCVSISGQILASDGPGDCRGNIQNCQFGREDWISASISGSTGELDMFNIRYKGTRDSPTAGGPLFISAQRITSAGTKNYTVA
jgi:hypothetical protein